MTSETRIRERFIENINNVSGREDDLYTYTATAVPLLTLMTWSICVQPGQALLTACLHLIPLFQADKKRDIKHDKSKQTSADIYE